LIRNDKIETGVKLGYKGRKKALSTAAVMQLRARITAGISKAKVAREFGISRQTLYQYLQGSEAAP
jgi:DNA invertase Pin-like site-specific DNA recombinase